MKEACYLKWKSLLEIESSVGFDCSRHFSNTIFSVSTKSFHPGWLNPLSWLGLTISSWFASTNYLQTWKFYLKWTNSTYYLNYKSPNGYIFDVQYLTYPYFCKWARSWFPFPPYTFRLGGTFHYLLCNMVCYFSKYRSASLAAYMHFCTLVCLLSKFRLHKIHPSGRWSSVWMNLNAILYMIKIIIFQ